ncbi:MAG: aldo/keto reductase [Eubacteriales bacterium]|jgi:predicted aldo/keto reductase-like oxidoreductase|nr:aldo/keto reductase [Eubacteriales bacterium]
MDYREMAGNRVSLLGYGCMRFPTDDAGNIDEARAEALLLRAYEAGINYFDTAWPYHSGKSEPFVGKVMSKLPRDSFYLATKLPIWAIDSLDKAREIFDTQLEHLHSEYVDYYLLHALDEEKWEKCLKLGIVDFLVEQKRLGRIRKLGFSFHAPYAVFNRIIDHRRWDFCQIQLNYMDTEHQAGLQGLAYAEAKGIPCVIMEPVKGGTLASLPEYASAPLKAAAPQSSIASWAFRYLAGFDNVRVILSGMSSEEQLEDNLGTFSPYIPLSDHEKVALDEAIAALKSRPNNGCTRCKYCMPCASGVEIPRIFSIWNEYQRYQNDAMAAKDYKDIRPYGRAQCCIRCGKCEAACPQKIKIRDELKAIASMPWAQA